MTEKEFNLVLGNARRGDRRSMIGVAEAFKNGDGVDPSRIRFLEWLMKAQREPTDTTTPEGNHEKEIRAQAMYKLGRAYEWEEGPMFGVRQYFHWMKKAAELGHPEAMHHLAQALLDGRYGCPDLARALEWLQNAAEGGNSKAQYDLAIAYMEGRLTAPDKRLFKSWLRRAIKNGEDDAIPDLADAYKNRSKKYREILKIGEKRAHAQSMYLLAMTYKPRGTVRANARTSGGKLRNRNIANMRTYFRLVKASAEQDFSDAMYELALAYREGTGTRSDKNECFTWLKKAAEADQLDAVYELAEAYAVRPQSYDPSRFAFWIEKAVRNGYPKARVCSGLRELVRELEQRELRRLIRLLSNLFNVVQAILREHKVGKRRAPKGLLTTRALIGCVLCYLFRLAPTKHPAAFGFPTPLV